MRVKTYAHGDKEDNWMLGEKIGLSEQAISENFKYINYELEIEYEVDMATGKFEMISVDGRKFVI